MVKKANKDIEERLAARAELLEIINHRKNKTNISSHLDKKLESLLKKIEGEIADLAAARFLPITRSEPAHGGSDR